MNSIKRIRPFDLGERTFLFASEIKGFTKKAPKTNANYEYNKQLIRSSGSMAANYIEADEALSKRDFIYRLRVCRKETKESILWLKLLDSDTEALEIERRIHIQECDELLKIFSARITKYSNKDIPWRNLL